MSEDIIRKAYYNPAEGFVGVDKLYRKVKKAGFKRKQVADFLAKQEVYQRSRKNNQKQGSFIPKFPLQEFQIDLIYIEDKHLNQASYGLCCIDAFSKQGDIELMKRKTKGVTVDAMTEVMDRMGVPKMIYCDEGSEFNNAPFKAMCKKLGIRLVFTMRHAAMVERFNRTIKEMIYKYMQSTGTKSITNVLKSILQNYNNSFHSSIGMPPNEVNENTMHRVQLNLMKRFKKPSHMKLKVGDDVRVQLKEKSFTKGYRPKYSKDIYKVVEVGDGYYLTDKDDREYLRGNLQKVGAYEINPEKPDLEGTQEGHLKSMKRPPRSKAVIEKEEIEEKIGSRRLRERKPTNQLVSDRYGKINY